MNKHPFLAMVVITVTLFFSVVAQDHGPPAGGSDKNLKDSVSGVKGRSNEIERVKRDAEKAESSPVGTSPAPSFSQIKEDFERIQIINSDVLQVNVSGGTPAYERISEAAAEIEKRANRLKSNLFPPKSGKHSKENWQDVEDQELKAVIIVLDKAIADFTHSPIFQHVSVVNPEDATNAQKELEKIIKLSAEIKLKADRMKQASTPPL